MKSYEQKCIDWFNANANGKDSILVKVARRIANGNNGWDDEWTKDMRVSDEIFTITKSSLHRDRGFMLNMLCYPFECFEVVDNIQSNSIKGKTFTVRWQEAIGINIPAKEIACGIKMEEYRLDPVFRVATGFATREDASRFVSLIGKCFGLWITETTADPSCGMPKEALGV
jgi:hypothetical protein